MAPTRHHSGRAYRDLADWLDALRLRDRAPRTVDDYERTIDLFIALHDRDVDEYTTADIENFVMQEWGASPGSRVRISHLKSFFGWLNRRGRIARDPAILIEVASRRRQKVVNTFSEAELSRIYVTDSLAALLCETGMRKSEARCLRRSHIDLFTSELIIYDGKGGKDRVIPLTAKASEIIEDLDRAGLALTDHLWASRPGGGSVIRRDRPISNTAMQRWWADPDVGVLARAHVPYRNMHVTRHTFATRLIRRGARLENVRKLMGHSSIQTTADIYGHLDVEDARADIRLLDA